MATAASHLAHLSQEQHQALSARLEVFTRNWTEASLAEQVHSLAVDDPARSAFLIELVRADLGQRWQRGQRITLDSYLSGHPELGPADRIPVELVQAEHEVRQRHGDITSFDDLRRRFPRQTEQLAATSPMVPTLAPSAVASDTAANPPATRIVPPVPAAIPGDLPEQFGRYRILKKLGQGGMGAVYLAQDTRLDRQVALKVQLGALADHPEVRERFFREARAASSLRHPNLCPVFDADEIGGIPFLTMAFIEGRPLSDLLKGSEPLPERQVAALVRKLARAMEQAHAAGVIHRDLKPANILLTPQHEPVITDFGLARRDGSEDARLTQAGQMMGTPAYMPPEQVRGDIEQIGPRCDVYSLGVILYELLAGRLPYSGATGQVLAGVVSADPPAPPSRHRAGLDPALEAICLKAMNKRPEGRFTGMAQFAEALEAYLGGTAQPEHLAPTPGASAVRASGTEEGGLATQLVAQLLARVEERQRRVIPRWAWAAAAAVLALLLGGVGYLVFRPMPPTELISVRLDGITINNTLVYYLNGKQIAPEELEKEISLPVGENILEVRRRSNDDLIEKRVIPVGKEDEGKQITVEPEKTDDKAVVQFGGFPDDDADKRLSLVLDGKEIPLENLRQLQSLPRGVHKLAAYSNQKLIASHEIIVGRTNLDKPIKLDLNLRPVMVRLKLFNGLDANDPAVSAMLDGEPVPLEELQKPISFFPGDHILVLERGNEFRDERFQIKREEDGKEKRLALTAPPAPRTDTGSSEPVATPKSREPVAVRFLGIQSDEDERELSFELDSQEVTLAQLRQPMALRTGRHTLRIKRQGNLLESRIFIVSQSEETSDIRLRFKDYRRVAVLVQLPKVDLKDPNLLVFLNGAKLSAAELAEPMRLLPGRYEVLLVGEKGAEAREMFEVPSGSEKTDVKLALGAPKLKMETVLFNGTDLKGWKWNLASALRRDFGWTVGSVEPQAQSPEKLVVKPLAPGKSAALINTTAKSVNIWTEEQFGSCILEFEFLIPRGSNSGVYLMGEYEVQIFDSYGKEKLDRESMGAIFGVAAPRANASKPPGEWQKLAIEFQAPRFEDGKKIANARFIKVTLNGQVIHEDVEVKKPTTGAMTGKEAPVGPLMLQGDHGPGAFRNIKIMPRADLFLDVAGELSEVVKALLPAARDAKAAVRAETAAQLAVLKDRTAVPLLCLLLADEHHTVRKAAAEGLEKLADKRAVPALRKRVEDGRWYNEWIVGVEDPIAGGKAAAVRALRALGPDEVTDALIAALESKEPHMRRWAARELMDQKDNARAVPALRKVVASPEWYRSSYAGFHDPDWGGRTDSLAVLRKAAPEQVTDALIEAAGSATAHVRPWAIVELSKQKDNAKAIPVLKKQVEADNWHTTSYKNDHDPIRGGKADALKLLRHLAPKAEVTAALCKALKGSHQDMRRWAAEEIAAQSDPSAVPALKERIGDEAWYERKYTNIPPDPLGGGKTAALKALRELARGQATEPLTKALFSRYLDQRKWAADELAIQNDKAAVVALKRRVSDDLWDKPTYDNKGDCADRQAALTALKALAPDEVKAALTEALKSKEAKVRQWAVKRIAEENK